MSQQNTALIAFNRGLASPLALARQDVKRLAMAAEVYRNWMPRVLGSMMVRPGMGYIGASLNNAKSRNIPFIFSTSDKARMEFTDQALRVWVDDALVTRPAVTTAIANGTFATDLASWTDADEVGGTSAWVTGGYMGLTGNGTAAAIRYQQVTVAGANVGVQHALGIVIERGPVVLRVGSTVGGDEYIRETTLGAGIHSLTLTPSANFYVQFQSRLERIVLVDVCNIEAAGPMEIGTPWTETDLAYMRTDQSGDVVFVGCQDLQQWTIERRNTTSWSVVLYQTDDGPFRTTNITPTTITSSVLTGNGTLTASTPIFRDGHVGALFALTSTGQRVSSAITAQNVFTDPIEVSGIDSDRVFTIVVGGTWTPGVVTLQRSLDSDAGPWSDVSGEAYTVNTTKTYDDGLDNQLAWYRIGIKTGDYVANQADVSLSIASGSNRGVGRVTAFNSATSVDVEVLEAFGATTATDNWEEGDWSDFRGWPSAPALYEGRLYWAGKDHVNGSVSDGFYSFDPTVEGDSGAISRSIGSGPVDNINWILSLQRLILGGDGAEHSCRSTSFDEPLTPSNFNIKKASRQGSAPVEAVAIDSQGIYIQRGGTRVFELSFSAETYDYASNQLSAIVPNIGSPGIVRMAVQRQPDTRVHFVRSDGTAAVLIFDKVENVICWVEIDSTAASGFIEDVCIMPGDDGDAEDLVYYAIKRTINGATVRYHEKWAFEAQAQGGAICRMGDSFVTYSGAATTVITGLGHLEGEEVVVWADSADVGHDENDERIYTVTGGQITLATAASNVMVGLPYEAPFQSGKLLQLQAQMGTMLSQHTRIEGLGLIMADVHRKGVTFGPDFDNMDDLPSIEDGAPVPDNAVRASYDHDMMTFPGKWSTDSRLCLKGMAPRPCTILAAVCNVEMHE